MKTSLKNIFIKPIKGYQYISKMLPDNCRYHPTCSNYAKWQFDTNRVDKALVSTTMRILRCNQLFAGGIDYPVIKYKPIGKVKLSLYSIKVKYWIIQKDKNLYTVIKDYDADTPIL